jgi:hypothetical protein
VATAVAIIATAPTSASAVSPIHPENRPTPLPGAVNGEVPPQRLINVIPNCVAAREAAPSIARIFAMARGSGVTLGTRECYRPIADQVVVRRDAANAGNAACAASVSVSPTGKPVGTSMHGWGKASDFSDGTRPMTFSTMGYRFLKSVAWRLGWNHPGWAEPGGSTCPEPWHWEWVGDGGRMGFDMIKGDVVGLLPSANDGGYATVTGLGSIVDHGNFVPRGSAAFLPLQWVMVGATATKSRNGYWMVGADGGVFSFGDARFYGSTGGMRLNQPVLGMARTATGRGYWLFAWDGGVFSFGDARFFGSTGSIPLFRPVVGMAATPSGNGYWLVASDGGVFSFGKAKFAGSMGGRPLAAPVVGMAATPTGKGYWLVAHDGGVFTFGDAKFYGSGAGRGSPSPTVGIVATKTGKGYWIVKADGEVQAFGDAGHFGNG